MGSSIQSLQTLFGREELLLNADPYGSFTVSEQLHVDELSFDAHSITIHASTEIPAAKCLSCGHSSPRIHSVYQRTLADLPGCGTPVCLRLRGYGSSSATRPLLTHMRYISARLLYSVATPSKSIAIRGKNILCSRCCAKRSDIVNSPANSLSKRGTINYGSPKTTLTP